MGCTGCAGCRGRELLRSKKEALTAAAAAAAAAAAEEGIPLSQQAAAAVAERRFSLRRILTKFKTFESDQNVFKFSAKRTQKPTVSLQ